MRRGFLARNQGAGTVGKHYAVSRGLLPDGVLHPSRLAVPRSISKVSDGRRTKIAPYMVNT